MPLPHLISQYPWWYASVKIMEGVCLIQINPEDQGTMSVIVYLDLPETIVRLTSTSACLIRAIEVTVLIVAFKMHSRKFLVMFWICDYCLGSISQYLSSLE